MARIKEANTQPEIAVKQLTEEQHRTNRVWDNKPANPTAWALLNLGSAHEGGLGKGGQNAA